MSWSLGGNIAALRSKRPGSGRWMHVFLTSLNCADHHETDAALPAREIGGNAVAVGRAADRRVVRPRAAAQYPLATRGAREVGAAVHGDVGIIGAPDVQAILP